MINNNKITDKQEWFKANNFSENGITYIVMGNSYSIKDILKEKGFKYSPLLKWHCGDRSFELPDGCSYKEICYDDYFYWDSKEKISYLKEGARKFFENLSTISFNQNSEYVEEVGYRFYDKPVELVNISGFDSDYGYKYIYFFQDEKENLLTWFTTVQQPFTVKTVVLLTGTVKAHNFYKDIKTTQLTRCKIKSL